MIYIKSVTLDELCDKTGVIIEHRTTVNDIKNYRLIENHVFSAVFCAFLKVLE